MLDGEGYVQGDEVTVRLVVGSDSVVMEIGPLDPAGLRADLEPASNDEISLSRLLSTLVEDVSLRESGDGHRLRLEKRVPMTRPEPREPV